MNMYGTDIIGWLFLIVFGGGGVLAIMLNMLARSFAKLIKIESKKTK